MITLCLTGIWGMKKNTTVWGAVIRVNDVIVPKDIPAVAVEINKSSELITEKLSRVFYTVYTDTDTLHIPVFWDVSSVNMKLAGVYTMKGVLKLPPEYAFDESESLQVQTTVSVQYPDKPDINIYYRLTAAGIYIFPWLKQENFDSMEAYLKKESGQWINLTEEGFALCEEEGLYVSNQSMVVGNTYSLLVTYDNGRKQTNTLRFQYQKDGSLKIYGYQHSLLGNTQKPEKIICSYDTGDEKYLSRCAAYAVKTGGSLCVHVKQLHDIPIQPVQEHVCGFWGDPFNVLKEKQTALPGVGIDLCCLDVVNISVYLYDFHFKRDTGNCHRDDSPAEHLMFIITLYVFRNEEPEHGISVSLVLRSGQSYQFSMYKHLSHLLEIDFTYTLYDKTGFVLSDEKTML